MYSLDLLRSHLSNGARGCNFYSHLLNYVSEGNPGKCCNLVDRCRQMCIRNGISLYSYVLDDDYRFQYMRQLKTHNDLDGTLLTRCSFYFEMLPMKTNRLLHHFKCFTVPGFHVNSLYVLPILHGFLF